MHLATVSMLMLALLPTLAIAQCIPLTGTKSCPELSAYSVTAFTGVTDVTSFDSYISSQISDSSVAQITSFQKTYQCPGYNGRSTRYHQSTICYLLVSYSADSCPVSAASQVAPLCKSTCNSYLTTANSTFLNPAICDQSPATNASDNRSALVLRTASPSINDFCNSMPNEVSPQCAVGTKSDVSTCGFANSSDGLSFCKINTHDPCCSTGAGSGGGISPLLIALITIAIVFLLFGTAFAIYKYSRKPKANSDATFNHKSYQKGQSGIWMDNSGASSGANYLQNFASQDSNANVMPIKSTPERCLVIEAYSANMPDELEAKVGDFIVIKNIFDDGWATGKNVSNGITGIFPTLILESKTSGVNAFTPTCVSLDRSQSMLSERTKSLPM